MLEGHVVAINMLSILFTHHAWRVCCTDQHAVKLNFFRHHAKRVCCIGDQHAVKFLCTSWEKGMLYIDDLHVVKLNFLADHAKRVCCIDDQHAVKLNFFADHAKRVWCINDQHAVKFLCTSCLKGMVYRWSTCCQISLYIMLKGYGVSTINMLSNFFVHHA